MRFNFPGKLLKAAGVESSAPFGAGLADGHVRPATSVQPATFRPGPFSVMRHTPAPGPEACQMIVRMISEMATTRKCRKTLRCVPLASLELKKLPRVRIERPGLTRLEIMDAILGIAEEDDDLDLASKVQSLR